MSPRESLLRLHLFRAINAVQIVGTIMNIGLNRIVRLRFLAFFVSIIVLRLAALGQTAAPIPAATEADSSVQPQAAEAKRANDDSFIIGDNDLLGINVWNEPDFKQSVPVRSDGKISLPLIGDVQAAGLTPLQLQQDIRTKLRSYIAQPDVTVIVLQINSQKFNILGRVIKPGSYSLSATTTVLDAIAEAGGFQDFAKQKAIYILRHNSDGSQLRVAFNYKDVIKGKHPEQNIRLEPHDTIVVP